MLKGLKKLCILAFTIGAITMLSACGKSGGSADVTVDSAALAKELTSSAVTSDTLTEAQSTMLSTIYFISEEDLAGGAAYMSAGSTACEVAVVELKDASKTKDAEEKFKSRVQSQSDLYASYAPDEVTKLNNAIIKSTGKYTVLVVCDNTDAANEVLKKYGF